MQCVKNSAGKTICKLDPKSKQIQILKKGILTLIRFLPDGTIEIKNINKK